MPILGPHSRNHHAAPIGDLKSLSAPEASILNSSFPRLATRDPSLRQSLALEPDRITPDDPRNCYFIASNPPQPFSGTRCTSDNGKNVFDGIFPALSTARASESRFPSSGLTPIGRRQVNFYKIIDQVFIQILTSILGNICRRSTSQDT